MSGAKTVIKASNIELGKNGESLAASFLLNKGYAILDRNWHFGHLELDLVCEKDDVIIFVEVKTRRGENYGGAAGAITENKKLHLARAAQGWLEEHDAWNRPCGFDIVCIVKNNSGFRVEHYSNAFHITQTMDSGYSHWECW